MTSNKEQIISDDEDSESVESRIENLNISEEDYKKATQLPYFNSKEKIILVIDTGKDAISTNFKILDGTLNPFLMLKQSIEFFVSFKHSINPQHEFALVLLRENTVIWHLDFTNKVDRVINSLEKIEMCDEVEDIFNLNLLFGLINDRVEIPSQEKEEDTVLPPPYIVRTILFYARSFTVPVLEADNEIAELLSSPYFIVDVLMTHEPIDSSNKSQKIFSALQKIDEKGFSYCFSVGRDARELRRSAAKLLAHPLQRPVQKLANYSMKEINLP